MREIHAKKHHNQTSTRKNLESSEESNTFLYGGKNLNTTDDVQDYRDHKDYRDQREVAQYSSMLKEKNCKLRIQYPAKIPFKKSRHFVEGKTEYCQLKAFPKRKGK